MKLIEWKRCVGILLVLLLAFALFTTAFAATQVMEYVVTQDTVEIFYLADMNSIENVSSTIGKIPNEVIYQSRLRSSTDCRIETMVLIDASISITAQERTEISKLLKSIIESKTSNESFRISTFDNSINVICDFTSDINALYDAIDKIQYINRGSSIYTAIAETAKMLSSEQRSKMTYRRALVVSDGIEFGNNGITKDEMLETLEECAIPVYTVGCNHGNNGESLKTFYMASRKTGGRSVNLNNGDTQGFVHNISEDWKNLYCTVINIASRCKDGGSYPLQLTVSGEKGAQYVTLYDIRMPIEVEQLPEEPDLGIKMIEEQRQDSPEEPAPIKEPKVKPELEIQMEPQTKLRIPEQKSTLATEPDTASEPGESHREAISPEDIEPEVLLPALEVPQQHELIPLPELPMSAVTKQPTRNKVPIIIPMLLLLFLIILLIIRKIIRKKHKKESAREAWTAQETQILEEENPEKKNLLYGKKGDYSSIVVSLIYCESGKENRNLVLGKGIIMGRDTKQRRDGFKPVSVPQEYSDVSREHCKLYWSWKEDTLVVEDLHSTNHTYVNDRKLKEGETSKLYSGDILKLAKHEIRVEYEQPRSKPEFRNQETVLAEDEQDQTTMLNGQRY